VAYFFHLCLSCAAKSYDCTLLCDIRRKAHMALAFLITCEFYVKIYHQKPACMALYYNLSHGLFLQAKNCIGLLYASLINPRVHCFISAVNKCHILGLLFCISQYICAASPRFNPTHARKHMQHHTQHHGCNK
jgi:hypothetical protein